MHHRPYDGTHCRYIKAIHQTFIVKHDAVACQRKFRRKPINCTKQRLFRCIKRVNEYKPHRVQCNEANGQHKQRIADLEYSDSSKPSTYVHRSVSLLRKFHRPSAFWRCNWLRTTAQVLQSSEQRGRLSRTNDVQIRDPCYKCTGLSFPPSSYSCCSSA